VYMYIYVRMYIYICIYFADETAVCRNPHSSSKKQIFCQNLCPKKLLDLVFSKKRNMLKCWCVKDLSHFSDCYDTACLCVTTHCRFMSNIEKFKEIHR
jgi:hypothetical protein